MSLGVDSLVLGTAAFGNLFEAMSDAQAQSVLESAWECGIRSFDTAPHYGLGLAERRLGAFLSGMPRAETTVSTKVGRLLVANTGHESDWDSDIFIVRAQTRREWDFSEAGLRASVEQSLERLGTDRVETLYLHDPDEAPQPERSLTEGLDALATLRAEGAVSRTGIGSKSSVVLEAAAAHEASDELMVAGRHTLIDHSAAERVLPLCREHGVRVVAAGVFNSGLLSTPTPSGTYDYAAAPAELIARAQRVADICTAHGSDLPTAALHYPTLDPAVTAVAIGARTPEQVRENVDRLAAAPDPALWEALAADGLIPAVVTS